MPDRIDLCQTDDPRDAAHQTVACLARGGIVALATDSGYGLVASALQPAATQRLQAWVDHHARPESIDAYRPTLLLRAAEELADWGIVQGDLGRKLPRRIWPGSVILQVQASADGLADRLPAAARSLLMGTGDRIAVQVPSDRLLRELVRLAAGPVVQVDGASRPTPPTNRRKLTLDELTAVDGVELILDSGDLAAGPLPTLVGIEGDQWSIIRPGPVSERTIAERNATIVLFVCTGNTCRSPMAEALCKEALSRHLVCSVEELVDVGYLVLSAGVAASEGMPAAENAITVVGNRGGSLVAHGSRQVNPHLVRYADHILAMTWDHLEMLLDLYPEAADRVRLLDPGGDDLADPVGLDLATYHATAQAIEQHLKRLLRDLGLRGEEA